jgi:hypothetical protein
MHKITEETSKYAQNHTRIFRKCTKSHEELPKRHKIPHRTSINAQNLTRIFRKCRFCAFSEDPRGILCIFGSFSQDCAYLRVPHGIVYILEVPRGILCIFGISSYNFVHFWKFLVGFCAFFLLAVEIVKIKYM